MGTYTQAIYHIVFSTKNRYPCLVKDNLAVLFRYIWGILKEKKCHLYRINGVEDHIHILAHIHPSVSLSALVKDIKVASSGFIKLHSLFPGFTHWQEGYGAFSCAQKDMPGLIEYIKNQEQHHAKVTFQDELNVLLAEHGISVDPRYSG